MESKSRELFYKVARQLEIWAFDPTGRLQEYESMSVLAKEIFAHLDMDTLISSTNPSKERRKKQTMNED